MNRMEAWDRAMELIPDYGRLLELRQRGKVWEGRYVRENTMPYWVFVMAAIQSPASVAS